MRNTIQSWLEKAGFKRYVNCQSKRLCITPARIKKKIKKMMIIVFCTDQIIGLRFTLSSTGIAGNLFFLSYLMGTTAIARKTWPRWTDGPSICLRFPKLHFYDFLQGVLTGSAWITGHGRWRAITPIASPFWRRRLVRSWRSCTTQ